jgi:hypothetical protein
MESWQIEVYTARRLLSDKVSGLAGLKVAEDLTLEAYAR